MNKYYQAVSLFRRKNFEKCIIICNEILQNSCNEKIYKDDDKKDDDNDNWLTECIWQLKMRAQTQRVFVDDLDANDDDIEFEETELERIATAARPGTSIKTAFITRPGTRNLLSSSGLNRPRTLTGRPRTGTFRPGTTSNRPGSAISSRPQSRCGTARRIRVISATAYTIGDPTSALFQASRMNPTVYAEKPTVIKPLFQFLFYHENDPQKALSLCEAVSSVQKTKKLDWWWEQQRGRCLIALNHPRQAEDFLKKSLAMCPHPDTYLLMCKMYMKLENHNLALQLLENALASNPTDVFLRTRQARILEQLDRVTESVQSYRIIAKMNPINAEALACIAVNYFYDNRPEMAFMYYRRILSMGAHSAELYCNIALCCLYAGQLDLVLPCFQRAIRLATTTEQRADIWYNLSFVGITTGDFSLTKRCLKLCLSLDSSNGAALNNLGVLSAHFNEHTKAKSYILAAQSALVDCPEIEENIEFLNNP